MIDIKLGDLRIISDKYQYIVYVESVVKSGKTKGDTVRSDASYFSTKEQLYKGLAEILTKRSNATTLFELSMAYQDALLTLKEMM